MPAWLTSVSESGQETRAELLSYLTADLREAARVETNAWIKRLRLVRYGGQSMREAFTYRGDSLWWFTELYLQKMRRLDAAVAATLALEHVTENLRPVRVIVSDADEATADAAEAFGRQRGLDVTVERRPARATRAWSGYLVGLTARLSRLKRTPAVALGGTPVVAAFVHTAFWSVTGDVDDPQQERYIGPVLDAIADRVDTGELFFVGVGPRRNFRARKWWDAVAPGTGARPPVVPVEQLAPRESLDQALDLWRRRRALAEAITSGEDIRAAAVFRGSDLWSVLRRELEGVALVQWPWSARAMDEAGAALDRLKPAVVVTYAEAGGWGRALVLEARRRGMPSVGLQHGFIYRHWLNYRHEPDEIAPLGSDRGCPLPDKTLVFDRYAADYLSSDGHFPPSTVEVTGNPRLDALVTEVRAIGADARAASRADLGIAPWQRLTVLAAKFSEIHEELPALIAALDTVAGVHLLIKPHPAETPDVYAPFTSGRTNVTIAPADTSLAALLAACDGLVTMNSTVAIDCLVLGVPSLVIGLPNNLSPFVTAGVMSGTNAREPIGPALRALLYDPEARETMARAADAFVTHYDMKPTGGAAARASEAILALAGRLRTIPATTPPLPAARGTTT